MPVDRRLVVAGGQGEALGRRASGKTDLDVGRRVIRAEIDGLEGLSEALDARFQDAVGACATVQGRIIVTGIGKSGHVGRKIAATLSSTGTPAQFVHPAEASHGDLGSLTRADALLILSYRGETAELSDLITYAKRFGIPLIGMASDSESTLLKAADVALVLPQAQEACPL